MNGSVETTANGLTHPLFFSLPQPTHFPPTACPMAALPRLSVRRLTSTTTCALARHRLNSRGLATAKESSLFDPLDSFSDRHIGPNDHEVSYMLSKLGYNSMDTFVAAAVPAQIRISETSVSDQTIPSLSESELLKRARVLAAANKPFKSYIGMGYHNAVVPPVILRNVRMVLSALRTTEREELIVCT